MVLPGTAVGVLAWMIALASRARDRAAATGIVVAGAAIVLGELFYLSRRPLAAARRLMIAHVLLLGGITMLMVNWRLHAWIAATSGITPEAARQRAPLWAVDLMAWVLWAIILLITLAGLKRRQGADAGSEKK
jgi:hypothetical protein